VTSDTGERFSLRDEIPRDEGEFLQRIIYAVKPRISLEIGLAYGISTLFICEALKRVNATKHILMDPHQTTIYKRIGLKNLRQAGYEELSEFFEEPSEIVLPELLKRGTRIDFAFVDGWHTFDHTLVDFFYINMMLNIGGVIAFDDANWPSVSAVCRFISRYPSYKIFGRLPSSKGFLTRTPTMIKLLLNSLATHLISLRPNLAYVKKDMHLALAGRCVAFIKEKDDNRNFDWHIEF
jgi:predicted O-methyltransferase YrrM